MRYTVVIRRDCRLPTCRLPFSAGDDTDHRTHRGRRRGRALPHPRYALTSPPVRAPRPPCPPAGARSRFGDSHAGSPPDRVAKHACERAGARTVSRGAHRATFTVDGGARRARAVDGRVHEIIWIHDLRRELTQRRTRRGHTHASPLHHDESLSRRARAAARAPSPFRPLHTAPSPRTCPPPHRNRRASCQLTRSRPCARRGRSTNSTALSWPCPPAAVPNRRGA